MSLKKNEIEKSLKIVSLISYSLIILKGDIIGVPFLLWLLFTCFEFGNTDQIFAIAGLIGISIMFTNQFKKSSLVQILSFSLMMTPIIRRLSLVSLEKFNYLLFQIPVFIFVLSYVILIVKYKEKSKSK